MKYITEQYLLDRKGELLKINIRNENNTITSITATICWVLKYVINGYTPSENLTLSLGEIRSLNKILDTLDDYTDRIDQQMTFSEEHFEVLQKVTLTMLPYILLNPILMNAPQIVDILENTNNSNETVD